MKLKLQPYPMLTVRHRNHYLIIIVKTSIALKSTGSQAQKHQNRIMKNNKKQGKLRVRSSLESGTAEDLVWKRHFKKMP